MEGFEKNSRREFLKKSSLGLGSFAIPKIISKLEQISRYTEFKKTNQQFKNGEYIYSVESNNERVGEFWPVRGINLVTKDTDPEIFEGSLEDINSKLKGVATAPDGMTAGSVGSYQMEGKALSNGRPCGDGQVKNYGIVHVKNGFDITFTHNREISDFDSFYNEAKQDGDTLFFLPSIYRKGNTIDAQNLIDKVLIRRDTPSGQQVGAVLFDKPISGNSNTGQIKSQTTHIYVLDGGPSWGGSVKEVYENGSKTPAVEEKGTRDPNVVTNYLVFY